MDKEFKITLNEEKARSLHRILTGVLSKKDAEFKCWLVKMLEDFEEWQRNDAVNLPAGTRVIIE